MFPAHHDQAEHGAGQPDCAGVQHAEPQPAERARLAHRQPTCKVALHSRQTQGPSKNAHLSVENPAERSRAVQMRAHQ